jgi:hypothetical protein
MGGIEGWVAVRAEAGMKQCNPSSTAGMPVCQDSYPPPSFVFFAPFVAETLSDHSPLVEME